MKTMWNRMYTGEKKWTSFDLEGRYSLKVKSVPLLNLDLFIFFFPSISTGNQLPVTLKLNNSSDEFFYIWTRVFQNKTRLETTVTTAGAELLLGNITPYSDEIEEIWQMKRGKIHMKQNQPTTKHLLCCISKCCYYSIKGCNGGFCSSRSNRKPKIESPKHEPGDDNFFSIRLQNIHLMQLEQKLQL